MVAEPPRETVARAIVPSLARAAEAFVDLGEVAELNTLAAADRTSVLLSDPLQDRCLARLGPGVRPDALLAAAHLLVGVALFRFACRRTPCRSVAPEGSALLVAAMPARRPQPRRREGVVVMAKVFIGVDPHKLSATIEVVDDQEKVLATGRFGTDKAGYAAMRKHVAGWPERMWAVEGSNGAGRPLAQRLLADGERVVDVPAKLSARARLFDTGHNRKTDAHDAHAVAVVAVRTSGLRVLAYDDQLEVLRMLVDRREELTRTRVQTVNRLQRLLSELTPGKAKKDITTLQAKAILASVRPRDLAGKTRRRLAAEQLADLVVVEKKIKTLTRELKAMVLARGSRLMDLPGVGPVVAARTLADVGDVARFADRNRFASWTGTAPSRHPPVRRPAPAVAGREPADEPHDPHRRRHPDPPRHPGRAYYRRKLAAGKTRAEAMRCLKRRISDALYRQLLADAEGRSALRAWTRVREGTAGRHSNPARPAHTRTPALRISHFPDPHPRRYPRQHRRGRPRPRRPCSPPLDNRGVPIGRITGPSVSRSCASWSPSGSLQGIGNGF